MYEGYRVKINDVEVPNTMIAAGTYSFVKEKRLVRSWVDANGLQHFDYYENTKAKIQFAIRERNLEEQQSITGLFQTFENLTVKYWDDYSCVYRTGLFKLKEPSISHRKAPDNDIWYQATSFVLEEY